ncbi:hypothetical protein P389DRAFT_13764 [Cystobasidium minutum MCA 4210]|uniref:uncharacterized protein n=1 Tax=Cystobasidium minutum MCA 4210 TaxID=1397322 RepID=UPI0034CFB8B4|eukprot:jgi/Rhomi1/13764/CE13763_9602
MADKTNTTTPCYVFRLIKFDEQGNKVQKRKYGFTAKSTAASELDENVFNGIITRAEQTFNLRPSTYSLYLVLGGNVHHYTYELAVGNPLASHPGMEFIKRAADFIAPPPPATSASLNQSSQPTTPVDLARSLAAAAAKASGVSPNNSSQSFLNKRRHWSDYITDEIAAANAKKAASMEKAMRESMESASKQAEEIAKKAQDEASKARSDAMKSYPFGSRSFLAPARPAANSARESPPSASVQRSASSSPSTSAPSGTPSSVGSSNDKYATLKSSFDKFVNDFNANLADAFGGPAPEQASPSVDAKREDRHEKVAQTVFEAKGEKESTIQHKSGRTGSTPHSCRGSNGAAFEAHAHNATCDVCDEWIVGVRYKCFVCPDWDCCEKCFVKIDQVHPGHALAALQRPIDLVRRVSSYDNASARHIAIHCDGCKKPISGVRYKCTHPSCPDFDLCASCEANPVAYASNRKIGNHSYRDHLLVKIRNPIRPATRGVFNSDFSSVAANRRSLERAIENVRKLIPSSTMESSPPLAAAAPATKASHGTSVSKLTAGEPKDQDRSYIVDVPLPFAIPGGQKDIHLTFDIGTNAKGENVVLNRDGAGVALSEAIQAAVKEAVASAAAATAAGTVAAAPATGKTNDKATTVSADEEEDVKQNAKGEIKETEGNATQSSGQQSLMKDARLMYDASWMNDVTFGDGESVFPGTIFNKIWEVRNTGTKRWPEGTRLICVSGFGKDLASQHGGRKQVSYAVKSAAPGALVQIVAEDITAPEVGGKFMSYYRFVAPDGTRFGDRLWIDIIVDEDHHQRSSSVLKKSSSGSFNTASEQDAKNCNSSLNSSRVVTPTLKVKGSTSNIQDGTADSATTTTVSAVTSPRSTVSGLPDTESMSALSDALSDEEEDCDFVLLSDDDEYDQV